MKCGACQKSHRHRRRRHRHSCSLVCHSDGPCWLPFTQKYTEDPGVMALYQLYSFGGLSVVVGNNNGRDEALGRLYNNNHHAKVKVTAV